MHVLYVVALYVESISKNPLLMCLRALEESSALPLQPLSRIGQLTSGSQRPRMTQIKCLVIYAQGA